MLIINAIISIFSALIEDPGLPAVKADPDTVRIVLQIVFGVIGAIAVFMTTFGGFKYVTSQGNPEKTSEAKNTILFAVLGVVISLIAFSIVTFVVGKIS